MSKPAGAYASDIILVVEDELLIRMALAQHLEECGYTVLEAENAAEAIKVLKQQSEIAVVFTDVNMPGEMDGLGLAKWVIANRPRIAVMVASGHAAKDTVVKELCGARAFIKPYSFDELTTHIRDAIQSRRLN
jgi:DNA-binding NtrC family response regulator